MPDGSLSHVKTRSRSCSVCGAPPSVATTLPYGRAPWRLIQCDACGFTYMPEVPATEELAGDLCWDKQYQSEAARRRREYPIQHFLDTATGWRQRLFKRIQPTDLLNRLGSSGGDVVDIGCGSGENFAAIDKRFTTYGIEISSTLAARAAACLGDTGERVFQASAVEGLQRFADASLAGAILRSFLEHDAQANEVMALLSRKLHPYGVAIIKVPNYGSLNRRIMGKSWCGFRFPEHVNYFRKQDLERLARSHNLSTQFPFLLSLPTDDNFIAILRPEPRWEIY